MKRIFFVVGLLLIAGTIAFGQNNAKVQAQLIQMDKDWTAAEMKGDAKTASSFIADDYWGTMPDGTLENKAQYTKAIKASKDTDFADDYSVRFFGGNTAIMTHRGTVKGERNFQYRSTHVWMNRGGKWQIVAHHSSEIPAGASAAPTMSKKPSMTGAPSAVSSDNSK